MDCLGELIAYEAELQNKSLWFECHSIWVPGRHEEELDRFREEACILDPNAWDHDWDTRSDRKFRSGRTFIFSLEFDDLVYLKLALAGRLGR